VRLIIKEVNNDTNICKDVQTATAQNLLMALSICVTEAESPIVDWTIEISHDDILPSEYSSDNLH